MDRDRPAPGQPDNQPAKWPIERVQKWVASALFSVTAVIFAFGLALLAGHSRQAGAKPGLLIIAAVIGLVAVVAVRLINEKRVLTPWLLAGLVPAALGWWLVLGR